MMIRLLRYFLFPFTILFYGMVQIRNFLYTCGILKSKSYHFPIILVGNVLVGGTGKTPMVSYITKFLQLKYKVAILSRGYGRKTKGFLCADAQSTATSIGDEPLQLFQNFGEESIVAVCENRNIGVQNLIPQSQVIVMDDAFQHRTLKAGLQIVLFPFDSFFEPQCLLPSGNLREPFAAHQRANIIVVSKCPANISEAQKTKIRQKIHPKFAQHIYFTTLQYQNLQSVYQSATFRIEELKPYTLFLITGIAYSKNLYCFLQQKCNAIQHYAFGDHHLFTIAEWKKIESDFISHSSTQKILLCTEKDAQRLKNTEFENLLRNLPLYYLPIEIEFLDHAAEDFNQKIIDYVEAYSRNSNIYTPKNKSF